MDFSDIFRLVNLAVGVLMVIGGVGVILSQIGVSEIIVGSYVIIFGLATGFLEFQIPPQIARYASFMFSFVGRGAFYIFAGGLVMGSGIWRNIAGALILFVGIGYIVAEYTPSIEPPANMRDADAGWGAEQV